MVISTVHVEFQNMTEFLHSGVDPNLIREEGLPSTWLHKVLPVHDSEQAARGNTFNTKRTVCLKEEIGGHKAAIVFVVASKLGAKWIFYTTSNDKDVERIEKNGEQTAQNSDYAAEIVDSFKEERAVQIANDVEVWDDSTTKTRLPSYNVAIINKVLPKCEAFVMVCIAAGE